MNIGNNIDLIDILNKHKSRKVLAYLSKFHHQIIAAVCNEDN